MRTVAANAAARAKAAHDARASPDGIERLKAAMSCTMPPKWHSNPTAPNVLRPYYAARATRDASCVERVVWVWPKPLLLSQHRIDLYEKAHKTRKAPNLSPNARLYLEIFPVILYKYPRSQSWMTAAGFGNAQSVAK